MPDYDIMDGGRRYVGTVLGASSDSEALREAVAVYEESETAKQRPLTAPRPPKRHVPFLVEVE